MVTEYDRKRGDVDLAEARADVRHLAAVLDLLRQQVERIAAESQQQHAANMRQNKALLHSLEQHAATMKVHAERVASVLLWQDRVDSWRHATDRKISRLELWRAFLTGGLAVLSLLVTAVVFPVAATWVRHEFGLN